MRAIARRYLLDDNRPLLRGIGKRARQIRRRTAGIKHHGRPPYRECVTYGAKLGAALGHERITVIEFGVATGKGLVTLEQMAAEAEQVWPIKIDVVGFDLGSGLPAPTDWRDLPWHWAGGDFAMDVGALRRRLTRAELILGDVTETVPEFMARSGRPDSPVGGVVFDLDYYTSTVSALRLLEGASDQHLPRLQTYFDDLRRTNKFIGVWLAIDEFNDRHDRRKIAPRFDRLGDPDVNVRQIFEFHQFDHPDYCANPRTQARQVAPLR